MRFASQGYEALDVSGSRHVSLTGCEIIAASTKDTEVSWESMRSVVATIEEFAQAQGADTLRILGRRGWQRVFRDFDLDYVCLTKKIREYSS